MNIKYNIYSIFEAAAKKAGDKTAVIEIGGRRISYRGLLAAVENAAANAAALGVKKGSKVLFMAGMSIDFYTVLLGLLKTGAQVIIVDPWMRKQAMERSIMSIKPEFFTGSFKAMALLMLLKSFRGIQKKITCGFLMQNRGNAGIKTAKIRPDEAALITFTTGSTGLPKGIIRTQEMLAAQLRAINRVQSYGPGIVDMQPFPVFLLANLGRGAASVIPWKGSQDVDRADMAAIGEAIIKYGVNVLSASPAFLVRLFEASNGRVPAGLKKIFTGGGMVTRALAEKLSGLSGKCRAAAVYGSTEAEPIAHIGVKELTGVKSEEGRCAGRPVRETKVRINAPGYAKIAGRQAGEIMVRGRHVCRKYFDVTLSREVKKPAWHGTGDIGYFDKKGRLYLCGRVNNLLNLRGKKFPAEMLELKIAGMEGIKNAAMLQDNGAMKVVAESGQKKHVLAASEKIADMLEKYGFGRPVFIFLNKIPKDPRHRTKTDYARLREMVAGREGI